MFYTIPKKIKVGNKNVTLNILQEGDKIPDHGKEYSGNCKRTNQPVEYYDNDGNRKDNGTLVKEKLAIDNTGTYYNEKGEAVTIRDLNRKVSPNWRKDKPEAWESFNGEKWVIDKEKKSEIEEKLNLNKELSESILLLNTTDHEIIKLYEASIKENDLIKERKKAREKILEIRNKLNS